MKYTFEKEKKIRILFSTTFYGVASREGSSGIHEYVDADSGQVFNIDFLSDDDVTELMEKSLKDGVDYLFEKVKDYEYFPCSPPDCLY